MKKIYEDLIALTKELPTFPNNMINGSTLKEYPMEDGRCFGGFIWQKKDIVGVHRWINTPGKFPKHHHEEHEVVIVYSGSLVLYTDDARIKALPGNPIVIEANKVHWAEFEEECEYITITIPPSKDFSYPENTYARKR